MPTVPLPITTYSIRSGSPARVFGSTAAQPVSATQRIMGKVNFSRVPPEATITNVVLQITAREPASGSRTLSVRGVAAGSWDSSVNWNKHLKLTYTGVLGTDTEASPPRGRLFEISDPLLTSWAQGRPTRGLRIDGDAALILRGSSAQTTNPRLLVTYSTEPLVPTGMSPSGDIAVDSDKPILSFAGDPAMTDLYVEIDTTGDEVADWNSGWVPATTGRFEQPAGAPSAVAGSTVKWRARVRNSLGDSEFSPWASYVYRPFPTVVFTNPGATSADGSPTAAWTVSGGTQKSYRIRLLHGSEELDDSGWISDAADRAWTPGVGVPSPGQIGTFEMEFRDGYTRAGNDTLRVTHQFTLTNDGLGDGMDTIDLAFNDPIVTLTATRDEIPDEIDLVRDGQQVPIWHNGEVALKWPATDLWNGGDTYTVKDYTAPLNGEHVWEVRAWTNDEPSPLGQMSVTEEVRTDSVWLLDPMTGNRVEIVGFDGLPVIEQGNEEQAILHIPISEGGVVEPVRRRLTRTTLAGTITGGVLHAADVTLAQWLNQDAGHQYRLIFGKVNWTVILGEYRPAEPIWQSRCGPERTAVSISWWQRKVHNFHLGDPRRVEYGGY